MVLALGAACVVALLAWVASHPAVLLLPLLGVAAVIVWKVRRSALQRAARQAWLNKVLSSGIEDCDGMSGSQFEQRISVTLEALGAHIEQAAGGRRDGGADIVAVGDDGVRIVLQCKCFIDLVGYDAVQQAYTARDLVGAHRAAVVTNSYLSAYAISRSHELGVEVWDRDYLVELFCRAASRTLAPSPAVPANGRPLRKAVFIAARPCPNCHERAYSWGPNGPPERQCERCGHVWRQAEGPIGSGYEMRQHGPTQQQAVAPGSGVERDGIQPQFSPDRKWWWSGTEWVAADPAEACSQPAIEGRSESEADVLQRALEVKATYGFDALTLDELRLLQDLKRRRRRTERRG